MSKIQVLDPITIDKIAAGEVIERPASVVKELVENAIDAGATAVVVEIKDGGISFMRITDNGCGIDREDVRSAFARRKFLKTPMTEASHVGDLMTRLALSHPHISFQFINNGQSKLHTSGNGKLKDVIYHIYGREIASNLLQAEYDTPGLKITGFLGKPIISRGNRNFENYYVNGRYARNSIISRAIEDAYKDFTMQHKYPFVVLHIEIDGEHVDVNVHPTKMELRFNNQQEVYNAIYSAVDQGLHEKELIPHVEMPEPKPAVQSTPESKPAVQSTPEPKTAVRSAPEHNLEYFMSKMKERVLAEHEEKKKKEEAVTKQPVNTIQTIAEEKTPYMQNTAVRPQISTQTTAPEPPKQMELFEDHLLTREAMQKYKVVGQVFETYWLVEYDNSLYIIDQHAAHERVLYEKTLKSMQTREFTSQMISPPIVLNLSMREAELLNTYMNRFTRIGFEIEEF